MISDGPEKRNRGFAGIRVFWNKWMNKRTPDGKNKKEKKKQKKYLHFVTGHAIIIKSSRNTAVGADYNEGPPVPIPNTEVKLICADDTWLETARNNR